VALLRAALVAATVAVALVQGTASACQWEVYERTYATPAGPVTAPAARCVAP
jgi:hypothetical protein